MLYLDHAASTAVRPEAEAALRAGLALSPANPTGAHARARAARGALEEARDILSAGLDVDPGRVVFTSGGTESDNWAISAAAAGGRVLYSAVEHPAVAVPAARMGGTPIPVDASGRVDLDALALLLTMHSGDIGGISVMAANNETGVIQPLAEVAALRDELCPDCLLHTDAVQSFCKESLDISELRLSAVSLSGHKIGSPIGTGALVLGEGVEPEPLLLGGGQERGRRAGTPDPAGAMAFAAAAAAASAEDWERVAVLRDRLELTLASEVEGLEVHGKGAPRLPTHSLVGVPGLPGDMAVIACDRGGLAISSGASCSSGAQQRSGTLAAMGASGEGALRFSLGWTTTESEVEQALDVVVDVIRKLRG